MRNQLNVVVTTIKGFDDKLLNVSIYSNWL